MADSPELFGAPGDRCPNCETPLAVDQRYCVQCGTRRGRSRFSLDSVAAQAAPPPAPPPEPKRRVRSRLPAGVTLVTGVATLLLAMGVGVLIGHDSTSQPPERASAPIVVNGTGTTGSTATEASTQGAKSKASKKAAAKNAAAVKKQIGVAPTVVHVTAQTKAQAQQAATKVFGQKSHLSKNPTVSQGQACSGGAGCQGGKFTGNFFGQ